MPHYTSYTHIRRLDTDDCSGILDRKVEISAKVDGTNSSVWMEDGQIHCGGRKREISKEKDNAGFWAFCHSGKGEASMLEKCLAVHPNYIIYGEWTGDVNFVGNIKAYDRDALGTLYIFDVFDTETGKFLDADYWRPILAEYGLKNYFVHSFGVFDHPSMEDIVNIAEDNHFLLPSDVIGEGVVIKPVGGWMNGDGEYVYGKYVRQNYKKDKAAKQTSGDICDMIIDFFVPISEVEKAMAKVALICNVEKFDPTNKQMMGRVLNMVFTDSICDECAAIVKKFKNPTIDFFRLKKACDAKVREVVFG